MDEKYDTELDVTVALPQFYLPYAAYVLQTRALPDARDGLKTGARYILYAQYIDKLTYDKKKKKASATVTAAMRFSPHGDAGIYANAIRMSQNFSLRYPVIEVQGNNGSIIYGDDYSASRYIEMRSNQIANEMTELLNKNTIDLWKLNYTQEEEYPSVLPVKFPFSLVNGNTGIGVGCSSSIPQFNLEEVCNALLKLINNPNSTFEEIYCPIDFATGGVIINEDQVKESLKNGTGAAAVVRAKIEYDSENHELIVTEMPYQTFTSNIVVQIQKAIDEGIIFGIESVFDGTDNDGIKIFIKLTKTAIAEQIIKKLYKETSLQNYYSINMMMLQDGQIPMLFNWKMMMESYLMHLNNIIKKSFIYDISVIKDRLEILEGYSKALENINTIIELIQHSEGTNQAQKKLIENYSFSERQAKAILDLKLQRLVNLEKIKIKEDIRTLSEKLKSLEFIFNSKEEFEKEIKKEIIAIKNKYKDDRRTTNINLIINKNEDTKEEVIVEKKSLIINLTNFGNLYTTETSTLIAQKKNTKSNKLKLNKEEYIIETISDTNYGAALLFSNQGKVFTINLSEIHIEQKINIQELLNLDQYEKIIKLISFDNIEKFQYIIFTTKQGFIKKSKLNEYKIKKSNGIIALKFNQDDELVNIHFLNEEKLGLLTERGHFLIIETKDINSIGRIAQGVRGIKLNENDNLVDSHLILDDTSEIISITLKGLIKRTNIKDFNINTRYTKGTVIQKIKEENNDSIISFIPIKNTESELIIISNNSLSKILTKDIVLTNKGAQGSMAIKMNKNEFINKLLPN